MYQPPKPIDLSNEETKWYECLPSSSNKAPEWSPVADTMEALFRSLYNRNAIPESRLPVLEQCVETFASNNCLWDDMIRHGHFLEYLRYFINGPDLPKSVIEKFCKILNEDAGTSGMLQKQLCESVRSSIRGHSLSRSSAATNFFRLAEELDLSFYSRTIRDAAIKSK